MQFDVRKSDYPISEEAAVSQLSEMMSYYDYDPEDIEDDDEKRKTYETLKKLVKHIRAGRLEVDIDETAPYLRQTLASGETLQYSGSLAKAKSATDGYARDARYAMIFAFMGSLAGVGASGISKLQGRDFAAMEAVAGFLMTLAS